jgi:hypothetical protein
MDANDRARDAVQPDGFSHDLRIAAEPQLPQMAPEHHYVVAPGFILGCQKSAANLGIRPQDTEKIRRHVGDRNLYGIPGAR